MSELAAKSRSSTVARGACAQDTAFALQAGGRDLVLTVIMVATVAFVLAPLVGRTLTRWLLR